MANEDTQSDDFDRMTQRGNELMAAEFSSGDMRLNMLLEAPMLAYMPDAMFPDVANNQNSDSFDAFPAKLSDRGAAILKEKLGDFNSRQVETANRYRIAYEAMCDAHFTDATAAANAQSDIHESRLTSLLADYDEMFSQLPPEDQNVMRQINLEEFGADYPYVTQAYRRIQTQLAQEFPDAYIQQLNEQCTTILANRDKPFRAVEKVTTSESDSMRSLSGTVVITQDDDDPEDVDGVGIVISVGSDEPGEQPQ